MHSPRAAYTAGFLLSVALTLAAYFAVTQRLLAGLALGALLLALALVQLVVQMAFFLHVGTDKGGRWKLLLVLGTLGGVSIIVAASVWIMAHLNYAMMASPELMRQYIDDQRGF